MWKRTSPSADDRPPGLRLAVTVGGHMEAHILKGRLEAENIPVHLSYESTGPLYGFRLTSLGAVHIMVPDAFERAARHICGTAEGMEAEAEPPADDAA